MLRIASGAWLDTGPTQLLVRFAGRRLTLGMTSDHMLTLTRSRIVTAVRFKAVTRRRFSLPENVDAHLETDRIKWFTRILQLNAKLLRVRPSLRPSFLQ